MDFTGHVNIQGPLTPDELQAENAYLSKELARLKFKPETALEKGIRYFATIVMATLCTLGVWFLVLFLVLLGLEIIK